MFYCSEKLFWILVYFSRDRQIIHDNTIFYSRLQNLLVSYSVHCSRHRIFSRLFEHLVFDEILMTYTNRCDKVCSLCGESATWRGVSNLQGSSATPKNIIRNIYRNVFKLWLKTSHCFYWIAMLLYCCAMYSVTAPWKKNKILKCISRE